MNLTVIKSNRGYYVTTDSGLKYLSGKSSLLNYLFDGVNPQPTFHDKWVFIEKEPGVISHYERQPNINHRYILTDDSLESDKIPAVLMKDDAVESTDCEGNTIWKPEYQFYKSLYVEVSDEQPDKEVIDEFTFNVVLEIGNLVDPPEFIYPTGSIYDRWADKNKRETSVNRSNIVHQELDKIIFPSLLIHETPCQLSSEDTYKVVREYISTHINPAVAVITSNYDFCFTVKKRIPLAKPYETKITDHSKRKGSKNRVQTRMVTQKEIQIFEMTHTGRNGNYSGYTPIEGFEARNEQELKEKIDSYLEDLISQINEPVTECPTCNGCGVLFKDVSVPLDERVSKD